MVKLPILSFAVQAVIRSKNERDKPKETTVGLKKRIVMKNTINLDNIISLNGFNRFLNSRKREKYRNDAAKNNTYLLRADGRAVAAFWRSVEMEGG